jgi:selenocysteine lyase/cysteine desulfurase
VPYSFRVATDRRQFLVRTGLALAAAGYGDLLRAPAAEGSTRPGWGQVRAQFDLDRRWVHLGGLLLASHPAPVQRAIEMHRRGLDRNPVRYLHGRQTELEAAVVREAAAYLGAQAEDIALTDSTTMGLGLVYNGIGLKPGDDVLTTTHDFFATHEALRLKAERTGAAVRQVALYDRPQDATEEAIVGRVASALRPRTRVLALTWVHSSTGVKLPIRRIAAAARRASPNVLVCVDGVHALGVEDVRVGQLGCDFLVAGCHKWLFGPRGTGIVWGSARGWAAVEPTIPSFTGSASPAAAFTPGGFHSFEHRWALAQAFAFHRSIGKARVARRIQDLNGRLKRGLAALDHVTLYTPHSAALSAGLVCFDVGGLDPGEVVAHLERRRIVATVTPYRTSYARLAPGLLNSGADVDAAVRAIRGLR